ncbi:uncharacterized protein C8R40DRAFT_1167287 [Lentinula edodes]|uniref:uncharacterized protein n=1 Tax=Lentinula edodes TaxID=5353 RepID=UPI001E8D4E67|nr:uncharacterized protein C8R40DRAFT_1167287 [Lentinula edodes]KAH7878555.1 hypothetical protein C8R40DRAFT_1167287 [Lentinula edodes]
MEPAGRVTVKALTPLDREVTDLCSTAQSSVTNNAGQYKPENSLPDKYKAPRIEVVPDEDMDAGKEEWQVTEAELEEWLREACMLRREETSKRQEELECRQWERQKVSDKEEEQWDTE